MQVELNLTKTILQEELLRKAKEGKRLLAAIRSREEKNVKKEDLTITILHILHFYLYVHTTKNFLNQQNPTDHLTEDHYIQASATFYENNDLLQTSFTDTINKLLQIKMEEEDVKDCTKCQQLYHTFLKIVSNEWVEVGWVG